jgi:hypothetical protein
MLKANQPYIKKKKAILSKSTDHQQNMKQKKNHSHPNYAKEFNFVLYEANASVRIQYGEIHESTLLEP